MPDFEKFIPAWSLPWEDDWVTSAAFVGSARRLAAGNQLGSILVWDLPEKPGGKRRAGAAAGRPHQRRRAAGGDARRPTG